MDFIQLFTIKLEVGMRQTDRQTDSHGAKRSNCALLEGQPHYGGAHNSNHIDMYFTADDNVCL